MKHYLILVSVLGFWTLMTMFMLSDCHQNICPQPSCLSGWYVEFFLALYGNMFLLYFILKINTLDKPDRRMLLFAMIYVGCLFLYYTA
jgi:hypothetical protein